jgi:hypothetical protein
MPAPPQEQVDVQALLEVGIEDEERLATALREVGLGR